MFLLVLDLLLVAVKVAAKCLLLVAGKVTQNVSASASLVNHHITPPKLSKLHEFGSRFHVACHI